MSSPIAVLWLLSAVLGEAFSLECLHCNSTGGKSCVASPKTCPLGQDRCVTIYSEGNITSIFSVKKQMVQKRCGVLSDCDLTFSMTTEGTDQNSATACCTKTTCTSEVSLTERSFAKNGVTCPSCFERNEKCKSIGNTECTGKETKCISFVANVIQATSNSTISVKGCATPTMCSQKEAAIFPGANVKVKEWDCSRAPSFLPSILFPGVSGLLWLKLLS